MPDSKNFLNPKPLPVFFLSLSTHFHIIYIHRKIFLNPHSLLAFFSPRMDFQIKKIRSG